MLLEPDKRWPGQSAPESSQSPDRSPSPTLHVQYVTAHASNIHNKFPPYTVKLREYALTSVRKKKRKRKPGFARSKRKIAPHLDATDSRNGEFERFSSILWIGRMEFKCRKLKNGGGERERECFELNERNFEIRFANARIAQSEKFSPRKKRRKKKRRVVTCCSSRRFRPEVRIHVKLSSIGTEEKARRFSPSFHASINAAGQSKMEKAGEAGRRNCW